MYELPPRYEDIKKINSIRTKVEFDNRAFAEHAKASTADTGS
jgi:hypothetical protein